MLKILFFSLTLLLSFNANAVVRQSISKALSYKNVVDDSSQPQTQKRKAHRGALTKNKIADPVLLDKKSEKVDMRSSDTVNINLNKNDEIEVYLSNDSGFLWKVYPSDDGLSLISDTTEGDTRTLKYKIVATLHSYIYFDYFNSSTNKVEKTKQLNIMPRD